jgi:hypothetical protein
LALRSYPSEGAIVGLQSIFAEMYINKPVPFHPAA